MAKFYNKTSTPLSYSLGNGHSGIIPPHQWVTIPRNQEGSSTLMALCQKRQLVRVEAPEEAAPPTTIKALTEPVAPPASMSVAEVAPSPMLLTEVPIAPAVPPLEEKTAGFPRRKGGKQ